MPSTHVNTHSHRQGNLLVELVVVVTILGVAGSFAIPRFTHHLKDGYPDPSGIRVAIAYLPGFTVSSTPTSVTYSKTDAPVPAQCAVTYHASPALIEAAITDLKTSGC